MSNKELSNNVLSNIISKVKPSIGDISLHIEDLRKAHPSLSRNELAIKWADRICWRYASQGAVTSLPGAIPGLGTAVQVGVETGAITADLAYMLRCMAGITIGIGLIYDRDVEVSFNQDFVRVLGLWCGVLALGKEATVQVSKKVAIAQFNRIPGKVFQSINKKVGTTVITKYGTKRGGIAVGRLVPFGVGSIVGGGFNLVTMKTFKKFAIDYYATEDGSAVLYEK